jgi:sugar diacid utilization regulator
VTVSQYFTAEVDGSTEPGGFHPRVIGAFEEVALLATTEDVSLNDVLRLAGQRLCELLGVSRCSVYLRRDDGRFQGQVGYCVGRSIDDGVSKLVVGRDVDQFSAEIIETRQPVLVRDAARDPRTVQSTMRRWGVRAMLGVPLVVDGEVIGIIFVDNQGVPRQYDGRDIQIAQAFAGLSALAVRQSWLYQQLAERMKVIDHQRRVLGETTVVHNRVTRAVLDGADTDEILRLIVELLGKPVVLYSPTLEVVSWAAPDGSDLTRCPGLTPEQLDLPWVRKSIASLHKGSLTATLRATPETRCRRLLVRMSVDGQCAGYLELCEIGRAFQAIDSKALAQASMAVALKLLADQRNRELHRQEREEYFADVLYGRRDLDWLTHRAEQFGIDLDSTHSVLRLQHTEERGDRAATGQRRHSAVVDLVTRRIAGIGTVVASTGIPGADLLLVELPEGTAIASESALGQALRAALPGLRDTYGVRFVVVSSACRSLRDLPAAAQRVRETADLLRETGCARRVAFVGELDLVRLIGVNSGLQGALGFAEDLLRPLVEHDAANGGALLETLAAFAQCQAQIRATATMLAVHENTVRYRLNRIKKVSSIDPERLESLLSVAMALQLRDLYPAPAAP